MKGDRERELLEANNRLVDELRAARRKVEQLSAGNDALMAQLLFRQQHVVEGKIRPSAHLLARLARKVVTAHYDPNGSWEQLKEAIGQLGAFVGITSAEDCQRATKDGGHG